MHTSVALICLMIGAGCQCCFLSEPYFSLIDEISDYDLAFDCLYVPELDPTRVGHKDWCDCPINRWICPCACGDEEHCCQPTIDFCGPPCDHMCVGPRGCVRNPYPHFAPCGYEGGTPGPYASTKSNAACPVCGVCH